MTQPVIILVDPQMGENIGMCARAMLNCGLTQLRLVNPRDGWPNPAAVSAASGALDGTAIDVQVFATVAQAVADRQYIYASAALARDLVKDTLTARAAVTRMAGECAAGAAVGVMFGPERTGLHNDHVALASALITIPTNPDFSSLNLAQAVLIVGYDWLMHHTGVPPQYLDTGDSSVATHAELEGLASRLEVAMAAGDFFRSPPQKPSIMRNLRALLARTRMTAQEVRTGHGIISALIGQKGHPKN